MAKNRSIPALNIAAALLEFVISAIASFYLSVSEKILLIDDTNNDIKKAPHSALRSEINLPAFETA
jgi:hypothetical protein